MKLFSFYFFNFKIKFSFFSRFVENEIFLLERVGEHCVVWDRKIQPFSECILTNNDCLIGPSKPSRDNPTATISPPHNPQHLPPQKKIRFLLSFLLVKVFWMEKDCLKKITRNFFSYHLEIRMLKTILLL